MCAVTTKRRGGDVPTNVEHAAKLFAEYGGFIRSVINFNVKNQALREDLFQDLFLYFVSKPIPAEVQHMKGFLYKVISDRNKDAFRRINRYQENLHRYACSKHKKGAIRHRPESAVIKTEEAERMFSLIARRLPPTEARAVKLRYRNGCDVTEAARKMRVKPRSISRYVSIGLKKIRCILLTRQGGNHDSY